MTFLLFFFLLSLPAQAIEIPVAATLQPLRQSIIALDHARQDINRELENKIRLQTIKTIEQNEYAVFQNYLTNQITQYCLSLYDLAGESALIGLPCHIDHSRLQNHQMINSSDLTTEEQIENLDSSLIEALGEFDEMLLKEDELVTAKSVSHQSQGEGRSATASGTEGKSSTSDSSVNAPGKTSRTNTSAKLGSKKNQGTNQSNRNPAQTRSIEELEDDIVARQLREAAEKEQDPKLKEKLWEEYRKYKNQFIKKAVE